jgi:predicted CXXCH cytochrome family protein
MTVCSSCHDSTDSMTHIDAMTTSQGAESCITCHGAGQVFGVDTVHKNR